MSVEGGRKPYQLHLGEQIPEILWFFKEGTMIWPEGSKRGVLRNGVYARKLEGKKIFRTNCF